MIEPTTYGSAFYKKSGIPGSGHETATVRIEPSGAVFVSCGLGASGQGYETTLAQCCAEGLGARIEDIAVRLGNSDIAPYGMGSRGARGATVGGGVVLLASQTLGAKVLAIAAAMLGPQQRATACACARAGSSARSSGNGSRSRSRSPTSRAPPISIRCGCRPAWSRGCT